jgi:hypothetical protein
MRRLYGSLACNSLDQGEFIPTQWLSSWLGNDEKLRPIDNSILLCEHGKLNPEKFREYKLVSSSAVNEFFAVTLIIDYQNLTFPIDFPQRLTSCTPNILVADV